MKHVYIAGRFSGTNAWEIEQNIRKAEELGLKVAQLGGVPVIPHTMYRFFEGTLPYEEWIKITMALLTRCDAIVMVPGWEDSAGSQGERNAMARLGRPIFDFDATDLTPSLSAYLTDDEPF